MFRVSRLVVALFSVGILLVGIVRGADNAAIKAAKSGDLAELRKLIAARTDMNAPSNDGSTPILWAVYHSDVEMTKALLAAGAKPNAANKYGVTPLIQASRTGDAELMDMLLKGGADPNLAHLEGETPLMGAARSGRIEAAKLLLAKNVNVNAADTFQSQTALMWAAAEGHAEMVDLLLKAGADPNRKGHVNTIKDRRNADHPTGGFTALMWAARNGHEETVKRLIKGGADSKLTNGDNATALIIAIMNDRFDMAATLVNLGVDVNDGSLYCAVEMREATTDQFAFDGSRLRIDNPNKLTALDLIKLLLEKGADPNKRFVGQFHSWSMPNSERHDNSALYRAAVTADAEALKLLAAHGGDLENPPAPAPAEPGARGGGPGGIPAGPGARGGGGGGGPRGAITVAMTGGRGPQMTGGPGYLREGGAPIPYREPGSRKPADAVAALLKGGANPNVKAADGGTYLHQAAQAGDLVMIRALAEAGAKLDATNNGGLTALDVAEGKQPVAGAGGAGGPAGPGARGARGARGPAVPAAPGGRGRGARGGTSQREVAAELRKLMGLPPAPAAPESAAPAAEPEAGGADPAANSTDGDQQ